jgi:hypothetical protein
LSARASSLLVAYRRVRGRGEPAPGLVVRLGGTRIMAPVYDGNWLFAATNRVYRLP